MVREFAVSALALVTVFTVACGGGSGQSGGPDAGVVGPEPGQPTPGGGVTGDPIAGAITVFVVDEADAPIAGASVQVGPLQGTTDADGRARFEDAGLSGPQSVTASATGRAAATWIGVAAGEVTLVLLPRTRPAVATATASGSIDLPSPSFGKYTVALILCSQTHEYGARENTITQAMNGDTPVNLCLRTSDFDPSSCDWQMKVRTGRQVHYAILAEGDAHGTTDASDDTFDLIGYAVGDSIDVSAGQSLTGETFTAIGDGALTNAAITIPDGPSGLGDAVALPFLDLGADGQLVFPLPTLRPGLSTTRVPAPSGRFAGTHYNVVGLASPAFGDAYPYSASFQRDTGIGGATLPAWLPAAGGLGGAGGTYSFAPVSGASFHVVSLVNGSGDTAWSITVLDQASSFQLPSVSPDPLPSSGLTMRVAAIELPGFDPTSFGLADFSNRVTQVSESTAAVTR